MTDAKAAIQAYLDKEYGEHQTRLLDEPVLSLWRVDRAGCDRLRWAACTSSVWTQATTTAGAVPMIIVAKFGSSCGKCGEWIEVGEKIEWSPTFTARHYPECPENDGINDPHDMDHAYPIFHEDI